MPRSEPDGSRKGPAGARDPRGERHPSGWRVRPGPDGRGAPPPPRPQGFGPGLLIFFLMLLLINIALTSTLQTQPTRVRIPYSPTFLAQVNAGNVSSISSKGTTVQGNFRTEVRYPKRTAAPTKLFVTELPEFTDDKALLALLQSKGVVINATVLAIGHVGFGDHFETADRLGIGDGRDGGFGEIGGDRGILARAAEPEQAEPGHQHDAGQRIEHRLGAAAAGIVAGEIVAVMRHEGRDHRPRRGDKIRGSCPAPARARRAASSVVRMVWSGVTTPAVA